MEIYQTPTPPVTPPPPMSRPAWPRLLPIILITCSVLLLALVLFVIINRSRAPQHITLTYTSLFEPESVIQPLIAEYQASHPTVTIVYQPQSEVQYRERLQSALSSGGPDIFRLHNTWVPMFAKYLAPLPSAIYSPTEFASTFYPVAATDLRLGSALVGIPLEYDGLAMLVNQSLLGSRPIPQSWDELRQTALLLSKCESKDGTCASSNARILTSGVALGTTDNIAHWQDVLSVLLLQNNVTLKTLTGDSARDVLDYFSKFNRTDHIWDSTLPMSTDAFASGKVAIIFSTYRDLSLLKSHLPLDFRLGVYPLPQLPIDPARGEQPIYLASYWFEAVNAHSKNSAAAWDFLKFLSSHDTLAKYYQLQQAAHSGFGMPPSRVDLRTSSTNTVLVSSFLFPAPQARSWYLVGNTFDGDSGINSQFSRAFAAALATSPQEGLKNLSPAINTILVQYGLAAPLPTPR